MANKYLRSLAVVLVLSNLPALSADDFPSFDPIVIDAHVGDVCYAITVFDVDCDGRQDIVAVSERSVLWYANPHWARHVLIDDATPRDNVCIAVADIDGDGKDDVALGSGWPKGDGSIHWLSRGKTVADRWELHRIGNEPSLHRMRFADVLGSGRPQLIISPLNKSQADGVRLIAFSIPERPRLERWNQTVMDHSLNRMHNHWHADLNQDGTVETLTASAEGIHTISRADARWIKQKLADGAKGDSLETSGAGEVKVAHLATGQDVIVSIEPMHGHEVVAYTRRGDASLNEIVWERSVLDDSLARGHALWAADLDRDGSDELIVGHSDAGNGRIKGPGLYVFDSQDAAGKTWTKHVIDDGGIATEDAVAADLNADGWLDIVAGGRGTKNVKLYLNRGLASGE